MRNIIFSLTMILGTQSAICASEVEPHTVSQVFSSELEQQKKDLIFNLYKVGAVKIGEFKLKSGLMSPIYFDLRCVISYPEILQTAANAISLMAKDTSYDVVCGVPYGAIPLASTVSISNSLPLIMVRKEAKSYGLKKMVEGTYAQGSKCLLIEDVVTTGGSVLQTVASLENEGVQVQDVYVLVDRKQGGRKNLEEKGCRLHAVLTASEIVDTLSKAGLIDTATTERLVEYIHANSVE